MIHSCVTWLVHTWHDRFIRDMTHAYRRERKRAAHSHMCHSYCDVWTYKRTSTFSTTSPKPLISKMKYKNEESIHSKNQKIIEGHQPFLRQAQRHWFQRNWQINKNQEKLLICFYKNIQKDINLFHDKPGGTDFKKIADRGTTWWNQLTAATRAATNCSAR